MAENKRYYWLKLNENFFEDDTIQWIEEQENGKEYVIFYLKLALRSLQDDGKLIRYVGETLMPYDTKALARLTNTNVDTVNTAMTAFEQIGLIERLETGELYMKQIDEMIGSETDVARRVRKHRAKEKVLKQQEEQKKLQSNNHETKSNTEIELDIEIEKDIDKEREKEEKTPPIPYKEIIEHLNNKANKKIQHKAEGNRDLIRARWNEGYTLEDFKRVIDNKVSDWKGVTFSDGTNAENYLHPTTLFRKSNFDKYLNQIPNNGGDGGESYGGLEF